MRNEVIPDAPPAGYIPLSAAFDRFWKEQVASIKQEEATPSCDFQPLVMEDDRARWVSRQATAMEARTKIYQAFLQHLRGGQLEAIVCHPITREKMPIPPETWVTAWFPERALVALAISGDEGEEFKAYVGRTPFVSEAQLAIVLKHCKVGMRDAPEVDQPGLPGSKKGSGSYEAHDAPLVARMHNLLLAKEVVSVDAAATKVAADAHGRGTFEAKVDRLARRYREKYGKYSDRKKSG